MEYGKLYIKYYKILSINGIEELIWKRLESEYCMDRQDFYKHVQSSIFLCVGKRNPLILGDNFSILYM